MQRSSSLALRALAGLVVAGAVLGLAEVALRVWGGVARDRVASPLAYQEAHGVHTPVGALPGAQPPSRRWGVWGRAAPRAPAGLRVLVLGGSTTEGERVGPFQAFAGLLERDLAAAHDGPVEVLNLGQGGIAARHVAIQLDAVLADDLPAAERPDLVVVYSGNNEFLEVLGLKRLLPRWSASQELARRRLWRLHLYRLLARHVVPALNRSPGEAGLALREQRLSGVIDADDRALVELLYAEALARMARRAGAVGVPLLLATVADNLEAHPEHADGGGGQGQPVEAVRPLSPDALAPLLEDEARLPAAEWHALGAALQRAGRTAEARAAFLHAERLDPTPHRSNHRMRAGLLEVAAKEGVASCDVAKALFDADAVGRDAFFDDCHPTFDGHRRIADALRGCIERHALLPLSSDGAEETAPSPPALSLDAYTGGRRDGPAPPDDGSWQAALVAGHQAFLVRDLPGSASAYTEARERGAPARVVGRSVLLLREHSPDFDPAAELPALLEAAGDPTLGARWE